MGAKKGARRKPAAGAAARRPPRPPSARRAHDDDSGEEQEEERQDQVQDEQEQEQEQEQEEQEEQEEGEEEEQQQQQQERSGPVVPVSSCTHLTKGVNVEGVQAALESVVCCCSDCNRKQQGKRSSSNLAGRKKKGLSNRDGDRALWVCLACAHVGCERDAGDQSFGAGHAEEHSRRLRHPLVHAFGVETAIWCFTCKALIARPEHGFGTAPKYKLLQQSVELVQKRVQGQAQTPQLVGPPSVLDDKKAGAIAQEGKNGYVKGLMNLGNTCFFNSVMQNLLAVNHLQKVFLADPCNKEGPLTSALRKFFQEINSGPLEQEEAATKGKRRQREHPSFNPKGLFGAICAKSSRFKGFQQQDSHELLRCLLDGLQVEEEARRGEAETEPCKTRPTFVERMFGGVLASTVKCCECAHSSSVLEPFLDLSLPIPTGQGSKKAASNSVKDVSKRQVKAKKAAERKKQPASKRASHTVADGVKSGQLKESSSSSNGVPEEFGWLEFVADDTMTPSDCITSISSDMEAALSLDGGEIKEPAVHTAGDATSTELPAPPVATSCVQDSQMIEAAAASSREVVDEAPLVASDAVILLPYQEEQEWEIVSAADVGGLDLLFGAEEDAASCTTTVQGCAEGPSNTEATSAEEIEPIIEESITPMTLQGCLSAFTKPELLSGDNAWGCEKCSGKQEAGSSEEEEVSKKMEKGGEDLVRRDATKSLVIQKAPPVLTVHLKRFAQDMRGRLSKLTGHVAFEELLNLKQFQEREDGPYRLVGVVEHSGTMRGGHYVAFVRGEACWYYVSDSTVRACTLEHVLRCEAYLLFYERLEE